MMEALVTAVAATFPLQDSMRHLKRLTMLDRFQASRGIQDAAEFVAETLARSGVDVRIHSFPCPSRWWTYDGPVAWTPRCAALRLVTGTSIDIVRYPDDAMCLATHSAATVRQAMRVPLRLFERARPDILRDAVVLIDTHQTDLAEGIAAAERAGALGVIADALGGRVPGARGRIELRPDTRLFGFSVTHEDAARLMRAIDEGAEVEASVSIDRDAIMPLVEAQIPGEHPDSEILIQAHLCHNRPGANDNASGVAAALGLAPTLAMLARQRPLRRGIRFLFGPEFVGTAAYAHDLLIAGARPRPVAAINLDMVGEDQHLCGGPLTLEMPPLHLPSPLDALAEHCLSLLPCEARTYSGALPARTWSAVTSPFVGASDHGILADPAVAVPAMMIGHWPDRFNHTSADTLDKVDPHEQRRAAIIAGACAMALACADIDSHRELAPLVTRHALRRLVAAASLPPAAEMARVFRPAAAARRSDYLDVLADLGQRELASLAAITGVHDPRVGHAVVAQRALLRELDKMTTPLPAPSVSQGPTVTRAWPGPFNVRGCLARATGPAADRIRARLRADKGAYATILALAHAIDNCSPRADIVRRAAYSSMLDIEFGFADDVFNALLAIGWASEGE
jgi:Peptidase family M28